MFSLRPLNDLVEKITVLKQEFVKQYSGNAHIQEILPLLPTTSFEIDAGHLKKLHEFASKNPIYYNQYEEEIASTPCIVYEGDISEYWLNSTKHGSSCQPFYPTWVISAYLVSEIAKDFGYDDLVDIGSGDGRIAFAGKTLGMNAHSIEIDEILVDLQNVIVKQTGQNFNPVRSDALEFDYAQLGLTRPAFFIGALPQMGGDLLATSIIKKIKEIPNLEKNACVVLAGTHTKRRLSNNLKNGGWEGIIKKHNLSVFNVSLLPAVWTFDQKVETPYIFTKFS